MISPPFPASRPEPPAGVLASGSRLHRLQAVQGLLRRYGLFGGLRCAEAVAVGAGSSEPSSDELLFAPENAERITSFAKKFFPSIGTIMICSLSESRSAMIFWMSMGLDFSTEASYFMRSASAAAVTRMRFASASERFFCRSTSALLSMTLACAAASAFCSVDSLRACASSLVCSICFCFSGSVYCMASDSALACSTRTWACASACFTSRAF